MLGDIFMNKCVECACLKCTCNNKLYPCELDNFCWGCDGDKDKENCKESVTELNCSFVARHGKNTVKKWQLNKGENKK